MPHETVNHKNKDPSSFENVYLGCKHECRMFLELFHDPEERQLVKRSLQEVLSLIKLSKLNQSDYKLNVDPVVNEENKSGETNSLRYSIGNIINYAKRIHNIKMSWFQSYEKLINSLAEKNNLKKCTDLNNLIINICSKLKEEELLMILKKLDEVMNYQKNDTKNNASSGKKSYQKNNSSNFIGGCSQENGPTEGEKSLVTAETADSTTCDESFSQSLVYKKGSKNPVLHQNFNNNSNRPKTSTPQKRNKDDADDDDDISAFQQFSTLDPKVLDYYDYDTLPEVPKLDRLPTHMGFIRRYYTNDIPPENVFRFNHTKGTGYFIIDPEVLKQISRKEIQRNEENIFGSKYGSDNMEQHLGEYDVYLSTVKSSESPTQLSTVARKTSENMSTDATSDEDNASASNSQNLSSNASRKNYSSDSSYGSEIDSFSGNESFWELDFSENEKKEKSKLFGPSFTKTFDKRQKFVDTSDSESTTSKNIQSRKPPPKMPIMPQPNHKNIQRQNTKAFASKTISRKPPPKMPIMPQPNHKTIQRQNTKAFASKTISRKTKK